jgi:hypothetical protein
MLKFVTAIMLVGFVTPALADFWVVKDPSAQKCAIVEKKPQPAEPQTPPAGAMGTPFQTQAEAQDFMQRRGQCGGGSD